MATDGPTTCCLSDIECKTQREDVGYCTDESFCVNNAAQLHLGGLCPGSTDSVGCCLSDVSCTLENAKEGFCREMANCIDGICEWDVPGVDCPGTPDVSCYIQPEHFTWKGKGTLSGELADKFGSSLDLSDDGTVAVVGAPGSEQMKDMFKFIHSIELPGVREEMPSVGSSQVTNSDNRWLYPAMVL